MESSFDALDAVVANTTCSSAIFSPAEILKCLRALSMEVLLDVAVAVEMQIKPGFGFDVL